MGQEINMNKPLFLRAADRERSKRRAQYRYKTTEHVQNRKHKRDMDGFFPFTKRATQRHRNAQMDSEEK